MSLHTTELTLMHALRAEAGELSQRMVANRRRIHMFPELGLRLPATEAVIVEELKRIGVDSIKTGEALSSVVAEIRGIGGTAGRPQTVALRADMDALPLGEHNDLDFASKNTGCMHACGHDAHISMLLGAAEILVARRAGFGGTVRLLFQPGEEGYGGARIMIEEEALAGVDAAFALHVDPSSPAGTLCVRKGTIMASADSFMVTFKGAGGHASMPHHTRDPIPAIGPFVDGLSHAAARETDPDDRVVLSVTQVRAGTTNNVIPPIAECGGTIRALSGRGRAAAHEQLRRIARGVAAARGIHVDVSVHDGYPPTVNHDAPVELMERTAERVGLRVLRMPSPVMGAEDFSYMLERVPGAFAFLGARTEGGGPLHSDLMKLDESVFASGAALHAAVAMSYLAGN
ncbi:MAG TPA: M20 family metallopeptidase [Candidatus Limnocylindrales bacterium]|nr:M20 family metallopeptidase [Candidatus Limnocylindrales bacterium]